MSLCTGYMRTLSLHADVVRHGHMCRRATANPGVEPIRGDRQRVISAVEGRAPGAARRNGNRCEVADVGAGGHGDRDAATRRDAGRNHDIDLIQAGESRASTVANVTGFSATPDEPRPPGPHELRLGSPSISCHGPPPRTHNEHRTRATGGVPSRGARRGRAKGGRRGGLDGCSAGRRCAGRERGRWPRAGARR